MNPLIQDIKTKLNIEGGVFIDAEIESYIKDIPQARYLEFFKALSGDEFVHKNKLDRIAIVADRYREEREYALFGSVKDQAKNLYDKFTSVRIGLENYITQNRSEILNDRAFFHSVIYENLADRKGIKTFSKDELDVLIDLGSGEFLISMPRMANAKVVTDKIEAVLKHRIRLADIDPSLQISGDVMKQIGRAS